MKLIKAAWPGVLILVLYAVLCGALAPTIFPDPGIRYIMVFLGGMLLGSPIGVWVVNRWMKEDAP